MGSLTDTGRCAREQGLGHTGCRPLHEPGSPVLPSAFRRWRPRRRPGPIQRSGRRGEWWEGAQVPARPWLALCGRKHTRGPSIPDPPAQDVGATGSEPTLDDEVAAGRGRSSAPGASTENASPAPLPRAPPGVRQGTQAPGPVLHPPPPPPSRAPLPTRTPTLQAQLVLGIVVHGREPCTEENAPDRSMGLAAPASKSRVSLATAKIVGGLSSPWTTAPGGFAECAAGPVLTGSRMGQIGEAVMHPEIERIHSTEEGWKLCFLLVIVSFLLAVYGVGFVPLTPRRRGYPPSRSANPGW